MTDRELDYIITISECKSISEAAKKLFISQPSLTQSLKKIETDVGKNLFNRTKTGLVLTKEGQEYVSAALRIQKLYRDMEIEIGYVTKMIKGKMKIGITSYLGTMILPAVLPKIKREFPNVVVELLEGNSTQLENMIVSGKIDIAIMHQPIEKSNLSLEIIAKDEFILAISKDNNMMKKNKHIKTATKDMIKELPMIMVSGDQRIGQVANYILKNLDINPNTVYTTKNFDTARNLAAVDLGVTLLPKSYVKYFNSKQHPIYLPLPKSWQGSWDLCIAYPKNIEISKLCIAFSDIFKEYVKENKEIFYE